MWTARRLSLIGFVAAASLLLLAEWLTYRQVVRLNEARALVTETLRVREQVEIVLSLVKDAETGQRGFLITGERQYLAPYDTAVRLVPEYTRRLRELTRDNPAEQTNLEQLDGVIAARLAELAETIRVREREGFEAAARTVRTDRGKRAMDEIRARTASLLERESRRYDFRAARLSEQARNTMAATMGGTALALAVVLGATALLLQARRQRDEERAARNLADAVAAAGLESETRLRVTLESIGDGVIAADEHRRVTLMNPIAQTLTGWTEAEARGRPVEEVLQIINEMTREPAENPAISALREGRIVGMAGQTLLIARDGREIPVDDSAAPIRQPSGRVHGVVIVFRDVTARREMERQLVSLLKRAQEARLDAEAASRAKDEFLATLSHELRTPLNSILGWVRMLQSGRLDVHSARHALEVIERNTRTQSQLIEDLLDVSRIVTGKLRLELHAVDLRPLVEASVDTVRPAADAKGVRIDTHLGGPAIVAGDPDRLQQVIWNLLNNAIRFTPKGGRIDVQLESRDSYERIRVSDTGRGIAAEFLNEIFTPFQQVDGPSRAHSGLGIGLALVRHLVELHGGTVLAESAGEGRGATFTVSLPSRNTPSSLMAAEPASRAGARSEPTSALTGTHVLVVDDDADARELVRFALVDAGADVTTADSASEALRALDSLKIDVLVSDIGMAGMDGYQLMEAIRAREGATERLPAVALTAYVRLEDRDKAFKAGFQLHVPKPVDPARLVRAVATVRGRIAA